MMKTYSNMVVIALITLGLWGGSAAAQSISCGDTIDLQNGTRVLDQDLSCGRFQRVVLTLKGPGTFDMAEHSIRCGSKVRSDGLLLVNDGVTVRNGSIFECDDAIVLEGSQHTVENMTMKDNRSRGVLNRADNSTFQDNAVSGARDGYLNEGDDNTFTDNLASNNARGFNSSGADTTLTGNAVASPGSIGFRLSGVRETVTANTAAGRTTGFEAQGRDSTYRENLAIGNRTGFVISRDGSNNQFTNNTVTGNIFGFSNAGDGTSYLNNTIVGSLANGITNGGRNVIAQDNFILGSRTDIQENVRDCDTNEWTNNTFQTTNRPDCVQ